MHTYSFQDKFSLCSSGWPGTLYVALVVLKFIGIHLPLFLHAGIKGMHHHTLIIYFFLRQVSCSPTSIQICHVLCNDLRLLIPQPPSSKFKDYTMFTFKRQFNLNLGLHARQTLYQLSLFISFSPVPVSYFSISFSLKPQVKTDELFP